ncbi:hypothetical protein MPNT_160016 [Candidatus Methylacidithermus pantelleriae]|uniref:Uncharacterized protein n=1 Tax=Candidatus Methylacidithermus pantelleriae TaxID=2744239 RepID=A0A8J2FN94_9BACT|nr:hypothetical protein MPNT_160016 [Candidatus Methylacidithermus pantelleriae]
MMELSRFPSLSDKKRCILPYMGYAEASIVCAVNVAKMRFLNGKRSGDKPSTTCGGWFVCAGVKQGNLCDANRGSRDEGN